MFPKLFPLIIVAFLLAACAPKAPAIEVTAAYEMGTVAKGDAVTVELPVRNTGRAPLVVEAVSTSCGCTSATLSTMTIPAGGEATLRVTYDSAVHDSDLGLVERYVFISSNDPVQRDSPIKFTALVATES